MSQNQTNAAPSDSCGVAEQPLVGGSGASELLERIVREGNELARAFYASCGYVVRDDFKFYEATHPQEIGCWNQAVIAYEHIEGTDLNECLAEWLEEQSS